MHRRSVLAIPAVALASERYVALSVGTIEKRTIEKWEVQPI
jgi:hypothetical protein